LTTVNLQFTMTTQLLTDSLHITIIKEKQMLNMNTNKDSIMSTMEEFGLTLDDVMTLMKGYEKFTESSDEERKELMSGIKQLIGSQ
jgi:hypothetical protein